MSTHKTTPISETYLKWKAINLTRPLVTDGHLIQGAVTVRIAGLEGFADEGSLQRSGCLTGLTRVFTVLGLKASDVVTFTVTGQSEVLVIPDGPGLLADGQIVSSLPPQKECLFFEKRLRPLHIERFRPENFRDWTPASEVDVYMAFGVLESATGFRYCCGVNARMLKQLGFEVEPKPDAILIDDESDEYRIAEFEVFSSSFAKHGHKPEHVDVVVAWIDDETNRSLLPKKVLSLRDISRARAMEILEEEG